MSANDAKNTPDLQQIRGEIDRRLAQLLPESAPAQDLIAYAMRESTLAPGKRIRPVLLVLTARELGCRVPAVLDLACAVEMVHAASLVLDDMPCMDDAQLRRGRPTLHRLVGEDVALLATIALLSRAFGIVATLPGVAPEINNQLVAALTNAVGSQGLVRGQFQDLRDGARARTPEAVTTTNDLKTGVLFSATIEMAALIAGADDACRASLQRFASELGQAFQLLDDLHDLDVHHAAAIGKDTGKDVGKSTLIACLGVEGARRRLDSHLLSADEHLARVYGGNPAISGFMHSLFATASRPERAAAAVPA